MIFVIDHMIIFLPNFNKLNHMGWFFGILLKIGDFKMYQRTQLAGGSKQNYSRAEVVAAVDQD